MIDTGTWQERYASGETMRQIAATDGVDWTTVRKAIVDRRRPGGRPIMQPVHAVEAVVRHGGVRAAADELGVSATAVRRGLWRAGLADDPLCRGRADLRWRDEAGLSSANYDPRSRIFRRDRIVLGLLVEGLSVEDVGERCGIDTDVVEAILREHRR